MSKLIALKHYVLTALIFLITGDFQLFGQGTSPVPTNEKYNYCEIIGFSKAFSNKKNVRIDFGQETKLFEDTRMRDKKSGELIVFNSMIDALNYMSRNGWRFVQAYVTVEGVNNVNSEVHWVLEKKE